MAFRYCIRQKFRQEKYFANFASGRQWQKFYRQIFSQPTGPLLCELSSPTIAAANAAVNNLQQAMPKGVGAKKRGSYMIVG